MEGFLLFCRLLGYRPRMKRSRHCQLLLSHRTTFVREGTRDEKKIGDRRPATEIRAAVTVIRRRYIVETDLVDLLVPRSQKRTCPIPGYSRPS
jgi:hypothetical protein